MKKGKGSESEVRALKKVCLLGLRKAPGLLQHRDRQLSPPAACAVPPVIPGATALVPRGSACYRDTSGGLVSLWWAKEIKAQWRAALIGCTCG